MEVVGNRDADADAVTWNQCLFVEYYHSRTSINQVPKTKLSRPPFPRPSKLPNAHIALDAIMYNVKPLDTWTQPPFPLPWSSKCLPLFNAPPRASELQPFLVRSEAKVELALRTVAPGDSLFGHVRAALIRGRRCSRGPVRRHRAAAASALRVLSARLRGLNDAPPRLVALVCVDHFLD
jgi:hypothetical protein